MIKKLTELSADELRVLLYNLVGTTHYNHPCVCVTCHDNPEKDHVPPVYWYHCDRCSKSEKENG